MGHLLPTLSKLLTRSVLRPTQPPVQWDGKWVVVHELLDEAVAIHDLLKGVDHGERFLSILVQKGGKKMEKVKDLNDNLPLYLRQTVSCSQNQP